MKMLRPFFPYYGGKWRAAPRYPAPQHEILVEPFAGAAGYATRHHELDILLFDSDEKVCGTWDYILKASADEIRRLPLWDKTWDSVDDLNIPQEARWLIGRWLNKGMTSPCLRPSAWMRECIAGGRSLGENYWGTGVRERIASQSDQVRHWRIHHADFHEAPDIDATWFVDPPYEVAGARYPHHAVDYAALASWCKSRTGQVIVCENEGADWLPFQPFGSIKGTAGGGRSKVSHEVIWTIDKARNGVGVT